ncbi:MAG TPA: hypothetical protein PK609_01280 [Candidatus Paceibacterota bacterium]|nr:hypothetical protein [Candidatus Paceibacterota bacterium]
MIKIIWVRFLGLVYALTALYLTFGLVKGYLSGGLTSSGYEFLEVPFLVFNGVVILVAITSSWVALKPHPSGIRTRTMVAVHLPLIAAVLFYAFLLSL